LATTPSGFQRALAYRWFWLCSSLLLLADRLTKLAIVARYPFTSYDKHYYTVFKDFFYLTHVGNTGAAWSMFSGRSTMLAVLALGTLGAIFFWRKHLSLRQGIPQFCFGLLCGGTVGNLYDRLSYGHVIDFLDFHVAGYHWPAFNLADSAIFLGAASLILDSFLRREPKTKGR